VKTEKSEFFNHPYSQKTMAGRIPIKPEHQTRVLAALKGFPLRDQAVFVLGLNVTGSISWTTPE